MNKIDYDSVRIRIEQEMEPYKPSQWAEKVGVAKNVVSNIHGTTRQNPSFQYIISVSRATGKPVDYFLFGDRFAGGEKSLNIEDPKVDFALQGGWRPMSLEQFAGVDEGLGFTQAVAKLAEIYRSGDKNLIRVIDDGLAAADPDKIDPQVAELLLMARIVLISRTDYAHSLSANIRSFHHSVELEQRLVQVEAKISQIDARLRTDRRRSDRRKNNPADYTGIERRKLPDRRRVRDAGNHYGQDS